MTEPTSVPETMAVFDALERRRQRLPETCRPVAHLVDRVCHEQGLDYSSLEKMQALESLQEPTPASSQGGIDNEATSKTLADIERPKLFNLMLKLGIGAVLLGLLILGLGAPVYAAFMTTICSWVGGCFLLSQFRESNSAPARPR
jgi:hypothetical protein